MAERLQIVLIIHKQMFPYVLIPAVQLSGAAAYEFHMAMHT